MSRKLHVVRAEALFVSTVQSYETYVRVGGRWR